MTEIELQRQKDWLLKQFVELFEISLGLKASHHIIKGKPVLIKKVSLRRARGTWKSLCWYCRINYTSKLSEKELKKVLKEFKNRYKDVLAKEIVL